jgi:hypothetical protein
MKIIGCDYHPSFQQIAMLDLETGEYVELRLLHAGGEAQRFYSEGSKRRLERARIVPQSRIRACPALPRLCPETGRCFGSSRSPRPQCG